MDNQVGAERRGYLGDTDDEDAVMGAAEGHRRVGEARAEPRRHDHERRAPGQPAALAEEYRLGRADGIRTEAREDLEAAGEGSRPAAER